jgi:anthranilate phosphoribosyltransferase
MKNTLLEYVPYLDSGNDLSFDQITEAASLLINESINLESKSDFLKSLANKGETNVEFSGFVSAFRSFARNPELEDYSDQAIDLCGTGGDRSGSFNISTFVSLLVAAGGVPVIKHGNRSVSSKCGSADLLEALGIPLETQSDRLKASQDHLNFCFLFAPHFHPAFKHLAPVRKALAGEGVITLFNRLGPCLNPALPAYQILGVYDPAYLEQIAHTLKANGSKSGWVVHGKTADNTSLKMDELTACGPNLVRAYGMDGGNQTTTFSPNHWGQATHPSTDLKGGSLEQNLLIFDSLLTGKAPPGLRASIIMNASTAFWVAGKVKSLTEGVEQAKELLDGNGLSSWLNKARKFFAS